MGGRWPPGGIRDAEEHKKTTDGRRSKETTSRVMPESCAGKDGSLEGGGNGTRDRGRKQQHIPRHATQA